jgi:hypothetical protein
MISMIYESMELWVPKELNDTNSWRNRCIMAQGLLAVLSLFFTDEPEMSLAIKISVFTLVFASVVLCIF